MSNYRMTFITVATCKLGFRRVIDFSYNCHRYPPENLIKFLKDNPDLSHFYDMLSSQQLLQFIESNTTVFIPHNYIIEKFILDMNNKVRGGQLCVGQFEFEFENACGVGRQRWNALKQENTDYKILFPQLKRFKRNDVIMAIKNLTMPFRTVMLNHIVQAKINPRKAKDNDLYTRWAP